MKQLVILLVCLLLIISFSASAITGKGYPTPDTVQSSSDMLTGHFGNTDIALEFDTTADYSYVDDSQIQACFFSYNGEKTHCIEFYIVLPTSVQSGNTFSTSGSDASVSTLYMYELLPENSEDLWCAAGGMGVSYPQGSSFTINIQTVELANGELHIIGVLDAVLCQIDESMMSTGDMITVSDVHFDFTLPSAQSPSSVSPVDPPSSTPSDAKPNPTVSPDYVRI